MAVVERKTFAALFNDRCGNLSAPVMSDRLLAITRPNQVWSTDITYIRLAHGFAYLGPARFNH